jgi:YesN/AraC family two-component response regulator
LLVEDEWFLLEGLRELLEIFECDYNLRVLTAANGVEGLKKLEKYQPDLIISDIMMPKMGGYEFLANVRENPRESPRISMSCVEADTECAVLSSPS